MSLQKSGWIVLSLSIFLAASVAVNIYGWYLLKSVTGLYEWMQFSHVEYRIESYKRIRAELKAGEISVAESVLDGLHETEMYTLREISERDANSSFNKAKVKSIIKVREQEWSAEAGYE